MKNEWHTIEIINNNDDKLVKPKRIIDWCSTILCWFVLLSGYLLATFSTYYGITAITEGSYMFASLELVLAFIIAGITTKYLPELIRIKYE